MMCLPWQTWITSDEPSAVKLDIDMPSAPSVISFRQISHRHWLVVLSSQDSTTAVLLHGAPASRNWNVFGALLDLLPGSFYRRQGGPTPDHNCVNSTGCYFDSGCKLAMVPTSAVSLQRTSVAALCAPLQFRSVRLWIKIIITGR